ncbi:MAG: DinB family protein [Chloroflexota bacterium]
MNADILRELYAWNGDATRQVLAAAERAGAAAWDAPGSGGRTLRETLVHLVAAQRAWLAWWDGSLPAAAAMELSLAAEDFPDPASLLATWNEVDAATRGFLAGIGEDDLAQVYAADFRGAPFSLALWQMLLHIAMHGAQHRAEAAMMVAAAGESAGDLDLLWRFLATAMGRPAASEGA